MRLFIMAFYNRLDISTRLQVQSIYQLASNTQSSLRSSCQASVLDSTRFAIVSLRKPGEKIGIVSLLSRDESLQLSESLGSFRLQRTLSSCYGIVSSQKIQV